MKCKRSSDGRAIDHHTLQVMRQQAVKAVREGQSPDEVAKAFGINRRTIFRWLAAYTDGGQNALLAKPIPGRPRKITPEQMQWIASAVIDKTPQQHKFEYGLWTLSLISELIHRQFKTNLALSTVSRIMKNLGFTVQKPLYQAWQQDPVLVKAWETETYPAIRKEAKAAGATIYFADEAGIRSDYHTGTTWAPKGRTPVVNATGRRFSLNMISAVSPRGDFRFMVHDGAVNAGVFLTFLKRLMTGAEAPIFLIVDGHPIHKAAKVKRFVESTNGMLRLFFLPPYSPHLNPDEVVWAHVKREVAKKIVESQEEMKALALSALKRIQRLPDLVRSFFGQSELRYITE